MTIEEANLFAAVRYVIWYLSQKGVLEHIELAPTQEQEDYLVLHPVFCAGYAGYLHACYHKERSRMRRQAQHRRGRLSRPQKRRWNDLQTAFQWLFDCNAIWQIAIERNGVTCFDCHACNRYFSKYYDRWNAC